MGTSLAAASGMEEGKEPADAALPGGGEGVYDTQCT